MLIGVNTPQGFFLPGVFYQGYSVRSRLITYLSMYVCMNVVNEVTGTDVDVSDIVMLHAV
jgi:hypothetical protein